MFVAFGRTAPRPLSFKHFVPHRFYVTKNKVKNSIREAKQAVAMRIRALPPPVAEYYQAQKAKAAMKNSDVDTKNPENSVSTGFGDNTANVEAIADLSSSPDNEKPMAAPQSKDNLTRSPGNSPGRYLELRSAAECQENIKKRIYLPRWKEVSPTHNNPDERAIFLSMGRRKREAIPIPPPFEYEYKEEFLRGSGPGGQNANRRMTTCYLVHKPTNVFVKVSDQRYLEANRKIARKKIRGKLDELVNGPCSVECMNQEKLRSRKAKKLREQAKQEKLNADVKEIYDAYQASLPPDLETVWEYHMEKNQNKDK